MNDDKPTYAVKGGSMSADGNSTFVNLLASGEGHGLRRDIGQRAIETMERVGIRQAGLVSLRGEGLLRCQTQPAVNCRRKAGCTTTCLGSITSKVSRFRREAGSKTWSRPMRRRLVVCPKLLSISSSCGLIW